MKLLCKDKEKTFKNRGHLDVNSSHDIFKNLKLSAYDAIETLSSDFTDDDEILQTMAQTYYSCNVSYVAQPSDSSVCWACSVASIGNYIKNKDYSYTYVAKNYYGSSYNQSADLYEAIGV